jgi:diguanylate cyclase (GGDEF)-like protein
MAVVFDSIVQSSSGSAPTELTAALKRHRYPVLVIASAYFLFCWLLFTTNQIQIVEPLCYLVFAIWAAGFAVPVAPVASWLRGFAGSSPEVFLWALWCNLGIVFVAVLFGDQLRVLLLVGVVFGVLYAALQLDVQAVKRIVVITTAGYLVALVLASRGVPADVEFELLSGLSMSMLLVAAMLGGREIVRLREAGQARHLQNLQLSVALKRMEELALRDELTGLYNRRHLLDFVQSQLASANRGGPSFTLCYCDLDFFKRVNDRFGHECGDDLLRAFAGAARTSVRTQDLVARLGGEEFVLVLVGADLAASMRIVERLRRATANIPVHPSAADYRVTLSVGIAQSRSHDTVDTLLRRADRALYEAKDSGRDQLVLARREPVEV